MRFIAFTLPLEQYKRWLSVLPLPSHQKVLTSSEGAKMQIIYELEYKPSNPSDWYTIDKLIFSYQHHINGVIFNDHAFSNINVPKASEKRYSLSELKVFPFDDRSYPAIMRWSNSKKGFRRVAFTYAKRLKYEQLLTYPAIMGAIFALHEKLPTGERMKARTLEKLANDILERSREWKEKLPPEQLHVVRVGLGVRRGEQLQAEKEERIEVIKEALKSGEFLKPSGSINQVKLSEFLGLHRNTIRNLIPFVLMALLILLWIRPPTLSPNPLFSISEDCIEGMDYSNATI